MRDRPPATPSSFEVVAGRAGVPFDRRRSSSSSAFRTMRVSQALARRGSLSWPACSSARAIALCTTSSASGAGRPGRRASASRWSRWDATAAATAALIARLSRRWVTPFTKYPHRSGLSSGRRAERQRARSVRFAVSDSSDYWRDHFGRGTRRSYHMVQSTPVSRSPSICATDTDPCGCAHEQTSTAPDRRSPKLA